MVVITLYRYIRKQIGKKNGPAAQDVVPPMTGAFAGSSIPQRDDSDTTEQNNSGSLKWKIMLMIGLAIPIFLETLDYTVVATAQVHIASAFNRLDLQSYIGTVYLLTSTVFLPLFASIADVFGRHLALQISLFFFMVGSAISTGSHNMPTMLAGRGVAGAGAAGLLAAVRIILTDSNSLDDNNWQQSLLFVLYTIGFCLGPFIGGELVTVSFRWIFAINLPCAAVAMAVAFFLLRGRVQGGQTAEELPSSSPDASAKLSFLSKLLEIDWVGGALFMAAGILILLALNWGSTEQWDTAKVVVCFVIGGVLLLAFLFWEHVLVQKANYGGTSTLRRALYTGPMIPLAIFKSLDVCIVMYGVFVSGMIMLVMFYFVAIFMTIVTDLPPNKAGVQLLYFAPGMGGGSIISIIMIRRLRQPKIAIVLSGVVNTVALGLISMGMQQNKQNLVNGFMAMAGVGVGLGIGPLAVQARFTQPEERVAIIAALTLFFRSFGGTVGLAQCGAVLNGKVNHYITRLVTSGVISGAAAQAIASASSSSDLSSIQSISSLPPDIQEFVRDAFRDGSRWSIISLVPWAAVATISSLFLSRIQDRTRAGVAKADDERPPVESLPGKEKNIQVTVNDRGSKAEPARADT